MRTAALLKQPAPVVRMKSGTELYAKLEAMSSAAYALGHHIHSYRAIPAHPANDDYRARMMELIEEAADDMRKALCDG